MKIHKVKCWPEYFSAVKSGCKPFEVRKNDRDYEVGDILQQYEWNPETEEASGEAVAHEITYVLRGGSFGIEIGYVVMGLKECKDGIHI